MIVRPSNAAALIELRVEMEERGGKIEIAFPYGTLEPIRDLLLQMFLGEKFGRDNIWEKPPRETKVNATRIKVKAVLDRLTVPLSEVLSWKPGSQIVLNAGPDSMVDMQAGDIPIFQGRMGRKNNKVAIRIEDRARSQEQIGHGRTVGCAAEAGDAGSDRRARHRGAGGAGRRRHRRRDGCFAS